jgi:hypothetical protein
VSERIEQLHRAVKTMHRCITALEIPPVESPITAVRAAIMAELKGK